MLLWIIFAGAHAARVQTTDLTSGIPLSIVAREANIACGACRLVSLSNQKLALKLKRPKILRFFIRWRFQ